MRPSVFKILQDEKGINAFKYRIGSECERGKDQWEGRSKEIIRTIYNTLDTATAKLVDANSCYSPDQAIEIGKLLQDNGVTHFEEPCPYWEPEQTKEVTDALDIDVSGGEQDCDFRIWRDMIDRKIVNIFQPDVMYMGGLTRILKLAKLISKAGLCMHSSCSKFISCHCLYDAFIKSYSKCRKNILNFLLKEKIIILGNKIYSLIIHLKLKKARL